MRDLTPAEPHTVHHSFCTGGDWNGPHLWAIDFKKMEACNGSR